MNKERPILLAFLKYVILFASLFIIGSQAMLTYGKSQERGGFHSLTLSHGLSDLLVNTIYKDSEGFVWFGTESSLDRFDGNRIERFPVPGNKQKSRRVLCILEGPDKSIFIGTNQGLFKIKRGESQLTKILPEKLDLPVKSLVSNDADILFLGTSEGLYIYNLKTRKLDHQYLVSDNLSEQNDIKDLWFDKKGGLWILTPHRLWHMPLDTKKAHPFKLPVSSVSTHLCEINNTIYVGTDGAGIIPFNISDLTFGGAINVGNDIVTTLSSTPSHELLIGTDGEGIYVYSVEKGKIIDHFTTSSDSSMILRSNSVYSTLKDNKNILWVGYYQGGVDYTPHSGYHPEVVFLPGDIDLNQDVIRALGGADGFLVIGTHEGLVVKEEHSDRYRVYKMPEIASNLIMSVAYWHGEFYIGTYHGGLYRLNAKTGAISRFGPSDLNGGSVFVLEEGPDGNLWAGTSEGLYRFKDNKGYSFEVYTSQNSQLPTGNVYEIYFDSLGRGWVGTENGLAIWNGKYIQASGFPADFINNMKIRVVYEDSDHQLYFAPDRGVVFTSDLSLKNVHPIGESDDKRFSQITAIIEDKQGWIWLGTDKGLVSYNKESPEHFKMHNHIGGITNTSYTLAKPYEYKNGDILFGSTSGLHKVDLQKIKNEREATSDTPLVISEVKSGGKPLSLLNKTGENEYSIILRENQSDLEVDVTNFNYEYRDYFEIEYNIEDSGEASVWEWVNGVDQIRINDFPSDNFIINIKEAGNPESLIKLHVKKHRAFPWWWIAGGVLFILLLIFSFNLYRHKLEIKRLKAKETKEDRVSTPEPNVATAESQAEEKIAYRTTRLTEEECKRLLKKLDNVMKNDKPFKNPDLKIKDLATLIDANAHSLSYLFNQYLHKSYYDYVNDYRVREFKELVKNIDVSKYTLTSMAEKCGFSSRASFFRHFKNLTGKTPSEYLKTLEERN